MITLSELAVDRFRKLFALHNIVDAKEVMYTLKT